MNHYIVLGGLRGYLPNFCEPTLTIREAAAIAAQIHDLSESYVYKHLTRDRFMDLDLHKHGNEYIELTKCTCNEPHIHQDQLTEEQFRKEYPEFYTQPRQRRLAYDYYTVEIPEDIDDPEERARLAFIMAEEQARLYCIPCEWVILSDDGYTVKVRRTRRKV